MLKYVEPLGSSPGWPLALWWANPDLGRNVMLLQDTKVRKQNPTDFARAAASTGLKWYESTMIYNDLHKLHKLHKF